MVSNHTNTEIGSVFFKILLKNFISIVLLKVTTAMSYDHMASRKVFFYKIFAWINFHCTCGGESLSSSSSSSSSADIPSNSAWKKNDTKTMYTKKSLNQMDLFLKQQGNSWKLILNPSHPDPGRKEKINLNFYFYTSLGCFKKDLWRPLKAFIKPFEAPKRSVKIKIKLMFILMQLSEMHGAGRQCVYARGKGLVHLPSVTNPHFAADIKMSMVQQWKPTAPQNEILFQK